MSDSFDETFEEQQSREKFGFFFGQFSAEIRKNLLSKNISRPVDIYDLLYAKTRTELLAKNKTTLPVNLDDNSLSIRNAMLSKLVEKQIDLDLSGDNFRQSQISKNSLLQSTIDLDKLSNSVRDNLISKNNNKSIDLDKIANDTRNLNASHNLEKNIDLDQNSGSIRGGMLSKNLETNIDLDSKADSTRTNMLSSNFRSEINIDDNSETARLFALSKNNEKTIDLDNQSIKIRENQQSQNVDKNINLDTLADSVRNNLISNNNEKVIDLDENSKSIRNNLISNNNDKTIDLDKSSESIRNNLISNNNDKTIDLDKNSEPIRSKLLSNNNDKIIDLDKNSESVRNNLLSNNNDKIVDLDKLAESVRNNLVSNNNEKSIDLDKLSESVRNNLISNNTEKSIDLDKNSEPVRGNLLGSNVPNNIDLDTNSTPVRNSLLASNVPVNIDLDANSVTPRNNELASNVPINIDLDVNSTPVRNSLLARNIPDNIDLDVNSTPVRNSLLANNVPDNIDLDANSTPVRNNLLASNVPISINLDANSTTPRNQLLSSNTPKIIDLDQNSLIPRNNLLSNNIVANRDLDADAAQARNNLISANVTTTNPIEDIASIFRHDLLSKNVPQTVGLGESILDLISTTIRDIMLPLGTVFTPTTDLQPLYGLDLDINGIPTASITNAAQLYNLQKNAFMNIRFDDRRSGFQILTTFNSQGFQELLSFSQISNNRDIETNTTPASVIANNHGAYVGLPSNADSSSPVTVLLRPIDGALGTATSMMSNTVPTDVVSVDFNKQERGVVRIINTIKKDNTIAMAKNYDSQNTSSFIVGTNSDGTSTLAYSRYTIANPYQPNADAGTLELRIKNYAIYNGNPTLVHTMSFPPYVKSFQNSDGANWNKIDFLGRPEPIYTYSNSNREGSLSFYILTDYSQSVDVGYDYKNGAPLPNPLADSKNFSSQNANPSKNSDINVEIKNKQKQIATLQTQLTAAKQNDAGSIASIQSQIDELNTQITSLSEQQINNAEGGSGDAIGPNRNYSEYDTVNGNIYKRLINNGTPVENGSINMQTEQTVDRLTRMKKDLLFQPAFFSGDKVDFLTRMEFMSKLTRPARNNSGRGFSFTFPPVCHLHLGSWFNHDIIINNVAYDYSDAPWTVDGSGGRTQPMWALVTLSFNIVGTYGGQAGQDVPLADDIGGFYQTKIR